MRQVKGSDPEPGNLNFFASDARQAIGMMT